MATDNFMKLTVKNQSQVDALKKIGKHDFGVNGGRVVLNGENLSIFQGDVENFQNSGLGNYNAEQLETVFAVLDADGNGKLDASELKAFASLGEDTDNIIENDKNIIDETDFEALYNMAQDYVEEALVDDTDPTPAPTKPDTDVVVKPDVKPEVPVVKPDVTPEIDVKPETKPEIKPETKPEEKVTEPEVEEKTTEESVIDDNEAEAAAQELRTAMKGLGTDEKTVTRILEKSGYSSADLVKIMDVFENKFGESLMSDIQDDYSGKAETQLRNVLYNAAATEAQKSLGWKSADDIPQDVAAKAEEYYKQLESNNALGYMKEFNKLTDQEKSQILVACDMLHSDETAVNRLTQGMVWFGKEDGYVNGMISALKNTAGVKETAVAKAEPKESTTAAERATIDDNDANAKAAELRKAMKGWGTDEKTVSKVLEYSNYSSADIVKIMDAFESNYGETLMHDIQGDYSGKAETKLRNLLFDATASEAQQTLNWESTNDIPKKIVSQANELYAQLESNDATECMKDFSKLSSEDQAKIMLACDMLHPNESVMDRLTQDRVWFGKEDGYVDTVIKGMKKVANTKVS